MESLLKLICIPLAAIGLLAAAVMMVVSLALVLFGEWVFGIKYEGFLK